MSWSCFLGHPQSALQGSSCQPSGTSSWHEPSPRTGSRGSRPPPACDTHRKHIFLLWFSFLKITVHQKDLWTHKPLPVSIVSGGGKALLSPGPPSWEGVGGSTRWNSNGVRFCLRYTTWPSPAIRQTDREMQGKGAEQEQKGGSCLKQGQAKQNHGIKVKKSNSRTSDTPQLHHEREERTSRKLSNRVLCRGIEERGIHYWNQRLTKENNQGPSRAVMSISSWQGVTVWGKF